MGPLKIVCCLSRFLDDASWSPSALLSTNSDLYFSNSLTGNNCTCLPPMAGAPCPPAGDGLREWFLPPKAGDAILPRFLAGDGLGQWSLVRVAGDALLPRLLAGDGPPVAGHALRRRPMDGDGDGLRESCLPPVADDGLWLRGLERSTTTVRNGDFLCLRPRDLLRSLSFMLLLPEAGF